MSAYKTAFIRLGEAEYKRLREAEEELRLYHLKKSSHQKQTDHQQTIYENMIGHTRQNEQNFQKLVVNLQDEVSRIENNASSWVETQVSKLQSEFDHDRSEIQSHAADQINQFVTLANQQIQQKENAYQAFWLAQEEKISSIENRWQEYEKQAFDWIQKDQDVLDYIYDTYQIGAAAANHLELQRQYLNQVIERYNRGFFDIAASAGFQIFIELSNIRFQLEVDRSLQAMQYQNLLEKAEKLQETLKTSRSVHAMDADGNILPEMIDVDYWVEGRYQSLMNNADILIKSIQADNFIDLNQISQYAEKVNHISNQVIDLMTQARLVVLASQLRFNVAQIIVQSLEEQGFFLEQANYDKGDYRESFLAKSCNFAGNEVLVSIDPDPGLDEGGKIHIQSLDADQVTQHELFQRNIEIFSAIKENGIDVSDIHEVKHETESKFVKINQSINTKKSDLELLEDKLNHGRR